MARVAGREAVKGFCTEKERWVGANFARRFGYSNWACVVYTDCATGGGGGGCATGGGG